MSVKNVTIKIPNVATLVPIVSIVYISNKDNKNVYFLSFINKYIAGDNKIIIFATSLPE